MGLGSFRVIGSWALWELGLFRVIGRRAGRQSGGGTVIGFVSHFWLLAVCFWLLAGWNWVRFAFLYAHRAGKNPRPAEIGFVSRFWGWPG